MKTTLHNNDCNHLSIESLPLDIWSIIIDSNNFSIDYSAGIKINNRDLTYFILYITSKKIQFIIRECLKTYNYVYHKPKSIISYDKTLFTPNPEELFLRSISYGYLSIMKWFFYNNKQNELNYPYFHHWFIIATKNGHDEVFRWLYDKTRHHNFLNKEESLYNKHIIDSLFIATKKGMLNTIKLIIMREGKCILKRPETRKTCICIAVESGDLSIIKWYKDNIYIYYDDMKNIPIYDMCIKATMIHDDNKSLNIIKWLLSNDNDTCRRFDDIDCYILFRLEDTSSSVIKKNSDDAHKLLKYAIRHCNINTFKWIWERYIDYKLLVSNGIESILPLIPYLDINTIKWLLVSHKIPTQYMYSYHWFNIKRIYMGEFNEFKWLIDNGYGDVPPKKSHFIRLLEILLHVDRIDLFILLYNTEKYRSYVMNHKKHVLILQHMIEYIKSYYPIIDSSDIEFNLNEFPTKMNMFYNDIH